MEGDFIRAFTLPLVQSNDILKRGLFRKRSPILKRIGLEETRRIPFS